MIRFLDELRWRGLLQDVSDSEMEAKLTPGAGCYIGFDPTAKSLQLGNLAVLITAMHLGRGGLDPVILFGGATGAIGDPSGRSTERNLLSREEIDANVAAQSAQAQAIFSRVGVKANFVNNFDWTAELSTLDFLRDVGKHFTVNYMLAKETVRTRLDGDGISFTEFSYMLLQAHDYLHLFKSHNCRVQFGASDQWGNITAGLELIRRKGVGEAFAFCIPLILDNNGKKFGKSAGNAVWLDPSMMSPYRFHQFWLNTSDTEVERMLKIFTFRSQSDITAIVNSSAAEPHKRIGQNALADAVTTLVHGEAATEEARRSAQALFGGSISELSEAELLDIFGDVPSTSMTRERIQALPLLELFTETGLAPSKGEARKLISAGGGYINNKRLSEGTQLVGDSHFAGLNILILRSGKKNYHLLKITP